MAVAEYAKCQGQCSVFAGCRANHGQPLELPSGKNDSQRSVVLVGASFRHCFVLSSDHSACMPPGDELVAQALGEALWLIGLAIWHGQSGQSPRRLQRARSGPQVALSWFCFVALMWKARVAISIDGCSRHIGHASGVSVITTAAPTRQKGSKSVGAHYAATSSFVKGGMYGVSCR